MSWIEAIRNRLGLSQEELGVYLGCSRAMVWNFENKKKSPTTETSLKLNHLRLQGEVPLSANVQQQADEAETAIGDKAQVGYRRRLKHCKVLLEKNRQQLTDAKTVYAQALQCLQWIANERTAHTAPAELLNVLELKAKHLIRRNGKTVQDQLQHQAVLLQHEIDELQLRISTS